MKISKLLTIAALAGLLTSCGRQYCTINGSVENTSDVDTMYFARMTDGIFIPCDTVVLNHGKFKTRIACDSTIIASYYFRDRQNGEIYSNIFFIEPGEVTLNIGMDSRAYGTENNDIYYQITDSALTIQEEMEEIYQQILSEDTTGGFQPNEEAEQALEELDRLSTELLKENLKKHIDKPVGYFLFISCYNMLEAEEIIDLAGKVSKHYRNNPTLEYLVEDAERSLNVSTGQSLSELVLPAMDGGELKLEEIIKANKLTLIDCWASWCGPCRADMPHVVNLYAKYHGKGLEIVGISFDEDETAWKNAVKKMDMTWPQASELKSWDNIMTRRFGVTSIPHTILLDNEGTVIGQQLRGEDLEKAIKEYLD